MPNEEFERRAVASLSNEASLSQSSIHSLAVLRLVEPFGLPPSLDTGLSSDESGE
jgi:hypothetical protein